MRLGAFEEVQVVGDSTLGACCRFSRALETSLVTGVTLLGLLVKEARCRAFFDALAQLEEGEIRVAVTEGTDACVCFIAVLARVVALRLYNHISALLVDEEVV